MLDHQPNAIRHAHKARVVGVDAVHGEIVGVGGHTEAEAVHKVDVLVPVLPRLQVGGHDHLAAAEDVEREYDEIVVVQAEAFLLLVQIAVEMVALPS